VAGEPEPGERSTERLDGRERLVLLAHADLEDLVVETRIHLERDAVGWVITTARRAVAGRTSDSAPTAPCPTTTS
jgi:hypothetical protein